MTKEQKVKLIELVQEYFENVDEEDIRKYVYTIPNFEMIDILSKALFGKSSTECTGYNRTVHKHTYRRNLTTEEAKIIDAEYKSILETGAFTRTKSKKATIISEKVLWYNNILY